MILEDGREEWVFPVFNDPSHFVLDTRVELLGTMSGLCAYHTDAGEKSLRNRFEVSG